MQNSQQRKLDSLRRVQSFLDEKAGSVAAIAVLKNSAGRKQLDQAVSTIASYVAAQAEIDRGLAGAGARQKAQTFDLRQNHMQPIAQFARAQLRGVPDFAALVQVGDKLRGMGLVHGARAMATAATPHLQALVDDGHAPDTIDRLNAAATALESTIAGQSDDRVRHVHATKGIAAAVEEGRAGVKRLGSVVRKIFAGDTASLAAWRVAARVTLKLGTPRGAVTDPAVGPAPSVPPTEAAA